MFKVRKAVPADLDRLAAFAYAEAVESEQSSFPTDTVRRGVAAGLADSALARYWVLVDGEGEVVGSISVVREWSDWRAGYYWWIQSLYLQPPYRGKGLLKLLLEKVREEAAAAGAVELRLYVNKGNERAIRAYLREGFVDLPYQIMALSLLPE